MKRYVVKLVANVVGGANPGKEAWSVAARVEDVDVGLVANVTVVAPNAAGAKTAALEALMGTDGTVVSARGGEDCLPLLTICDSGEHVEFDVAGVGPHECQANLGDPDDADANDAAAAGAP